MTASEIVKFVLVCQPTAARVEADLQGASVFWDWCYNQHYEIKSRRLATSIAALGQRFMVVDRREQLVWATVHSATERHA